MTSKWYRETVDPNTPLNTGSSGKIRTPIVKLTKDTKEFIGEWKTLHEYVRENNLTANVYSCIYNNLNGTTKSAYGYTWMWKGDYEKYKNEHQN